MTSNAQFLNGIESDDDSETTEGIFSPDQWSKLMKACPEAEVPDGHHELRQDRLEAPEIGREA